MEKREGTEYKIRSGLRDRPVFSHLLHIPDKGCPSLIPERRYSFHELDRAGSCAKAEAQEALVIFIWLQFLG